MRRTIYLLPMLLFFPALLAACGDDSTKSSAAPPAPTQVPLTCATGSPQSYTIDPSQTKASYSVQEQFLSQNLPSQAIGTTSQVTGTFSLCTQGTPALKIDNITVNVKSLASDDDRRDNQIRNNWLQSNTYPNATFVSTGMADAPTALVEGQDATFKLTGNLTIHNTTRSVTFDVTGKVSGSTVTGTATTQILMKDFGFDPPSVAGFLTVKDGVTVKLDFTAKSA